MIPRLKSSIIVLTILFSVFCPLSPVFCAGGPNYVRVAIVQDAASLRLKISGSYEVVDLNNNQSLYRGQNLNTTVTAYKSGILLGKVRANTGKLWIKSVPGQLIIVNGRRFWGDVQLIKNDSGKILAVNRIEVEDYIKGILYNEASHFWPIETLKAQAVACRTYALYQAQENKSRDFDVSADIYSQVYGGSTSERYRTNKAVDQTKGLVLEYQGVIFPSYYHATCAGNTLDAALLWNVDIVPLRGVTCDFCKGSPHFNWHYVLTLEEIADKLKESGWKIKGIKDIKILGRDKSGRVDKLRIIAASGETDIPAKDFRNIFGPNIIKSTNFSLNILNHDAVFVGLGWGHGVGMCQWGAYFMAKEGRTFRDILRYYYPGSQIAQID